MLSFTPSSRPATLLDAFENLCRQQNFRESRHNCEQRKTPAAWVIQASKRYYPSMILGELKLDPDQITHAAHRAAHDLARFQLFLPPGVYRNNLSDLKLKACIEID